MSNLNPKMIRNLENKVVIAYNIEQNHEIRIYTWIYE